MFFYVRRIIESTGPIHFTPDSLIDHASCLDTIGSADSFNFPVFLWLVNHGLLLFDTFTRAPPLDFSAQIGENNPTPCLMRWTWIMELWMSTQRIACLLAFVNNGEIGSKTSEWTISGALEALVAELLGSVRCLRLLSSRHSQKEDLSSATSLPLHKFYNFP